MRHRAPKILPAVHVCANLYKDSVTLIRSAQMSSLPSDEEYLGHLYEDLRDEAWVVIQERAAKLEDPAVAAQKAIDAGEFKQDQFDELVEAIRESVTPSLYFRGKFIGLLRKVALTMLEPYRQQLENIPVGCLPTRTLNAGAYQTPRGGAVILLDSGVILQLGMLVRSFFAYYTWNAPDHYAAGEPYCHDHSRDAFGRTIQSLAAYSVTGDLEHLRAITTWRCPSLPVYDQTVEMFGMGIETFIMLHEYGHIALGHLGTCRTIPVNLRRGRQLTIYTNSQLQEFEADDFAFKHYSSSKMRPTDVAFSCGLLFHFFHLAELIRPPQTLTHPPGLARWQKIKNLAPLSAHPDSWANYLDDAFALLAEGLPRL
jgi:hypothetical protein